MGKISALRSNKPISQMTEINDVRVAVVILPSEKMVEIEILTEQYAQDMKTNKNITVTQALRGMYFDQLLAYHCLRDPDDPTLSKYAADSVDEIRQTLDVEDINKVTRVYGELMLSKYSGIDIMTEEKLEEVKKHLSQTELKDLSTVSLVHLANFHRVIVSNQ